MMSSNGLLLLFTKHPFLIGLSIRIGLMVMLPLLLDDGILLQGVKYTDIDYDVFTDAARYVSNGQSPFMRHTYRYTPFLALILSFASEDTWWRKERYFGRMLFCLADALCGLVILQLRRKGRAHASLKKTEGTRDFIGLQDALWWLYNPLPINICTRGSAESFVVLLSVLATVSIVTTKGKSSAMLLLRAMLAGIVHGISCHAKLYPVIYTASFMAYLAHEAEERKFCLTKNSGWGPKMEPLCGDEDIQKEIHVRHESQQYPFPWLKPRRLHKLVTLWIKRILTPAPLLFFIFFMTTFGSLTYAAVYFYGHIAMEEGLLYHFSRVDHRHNYSIFWYWIYLARARVSEMAGELGQSSLTGLGRILLLPQIVLLLYSSLGIAPFDLSFALFIQTFLFVTLNKVITAQYFTWYLVLLPLCSDRINFKSKDTVRALGLLATSIITWLLSAFFLEMKGMTFHLQVWIASIFFFIANVNLMRAILKNYHGFDNRKEKVL